MDLILASIVLLLCYCVWFYYDYYMTGIPGPLPLPVIGNMHRFLAKQRWKRHPVVSWTKELVPQYGTCVVMKLPFRNKSVLVFDPPSIGYILQTNFENYPKGPLFHSFLLDLMGEGIFNVDGEKWERQRKIASHLFSVVKLRYMATVFQWHGQELAKYLLERVGSELDMQDLFQCATLDSFADIGFGLKIDSLHKPSAFSTAFSEAIVNTEKRMLRVGSTMFRWLWPHEKALKSAVEVIDKFAYDVIARRRAETDQKQQPEREDLVSMFTSYKDESGAPLYTNKDLRDMILNFMIAGRDTTAQTLTWLFFCLARSPQKLEKVLEEMSQNRLLGASGEVELPGYENVKNLPYLKACIDETLRLYPPVPIDTKYCSSADRLPNGYVVPAGSTIVWSAWVMGRLPEYWDNPDEFRPERWLGENGDKPKPVFQQPPFIPFQYGPRTCLGIQMAFLEVKIIALLLLQKGLRLNLAAGQTDELQRSMTLCAAGGMRMIPTKVQSLA